MNGWVSVQKEELRSDVLKLTLYELNTAISPRDLRIKAVHSAIREFNHNDPSKHDQELDLHADKILLQKLSFCYGIRKCDEELGLLCGAMELIYRASRSRVGISFHEVGESLLPLFVDMLRWSGARRNDILLAKSLAEQKETEEKIKYDLNDGNAIAQHRTNTDFGRSNMMISAKSAKLKGSLSTVTEEKKEKGDEYEGEEEEETLMIQEEETFTASCSSNDAETEADMSSEVDSTAATAAIVPPKRQVRFSESVEVTSNGENMHETAIKIRNNDVTNPVAVKKVIKILRYFSRVLTAMIPMAHFPGLLDELIFFLRVPKGTGSVAEVLEEGSGVFSSDNSFHSARTNNSMESVYSDANSFYSSDEAAYASRQNSDATQSSRLDAIATIVNLACAEENKPKLLNHPGLLEAVICVARDDPVNEAREHASIVLMNLALVDSNKISMANSDELLNTILTLLSDEVVNVRRYASAVMLSLACVSQNTRRIVGFDEGRPLSELSLVLTNDEVEEIRVNVAECLFNCVRYSAEAETIELMGQHKHVLPALSATVLSDYSADVRAYSARTLEWLAADIHYDSSCHEQLLDALAEASLWTKTNCIVEALKAQASIAENRKALVQHDGILDALATLASLHGVNDGEVRECALVAIERLTHEPSTRKIMAGHEAIMTELTRATFSSSGILDEYEEEGDQKSRELMRSALKYLAEAL